MLNFRTIMVSDGNAANSQAEHDASLTAFYNTFGDVMDTDMIIAALELGTALKAASNVSSAPICRPFQLAHDRRAHLMGKEPRCAGRRW